LFSQTKKEKDLDQLQESAEGRREERIALEKVQINWRLPKKEIGKVLCIAEPGR
jgi:hypothetical protein